MFSASVPGGGASLFQWVWGDGSNSTSTAGQQTHSYSNPGIYLVYVAAEVSGVWHDNLNSLLRFVVQNSYAPDTAGNLVQVSGSVLANSTTNSSAEPVTPAGGFVEVSDWISEPPTNPNWQVLTPSYDLLAPRGAANLSLPILTSTNLSAVTVAFAANASSGPYPLTFSVPTQETYPVSGPEAFSNFTITLFVGPASVGAIPSPPTSPHPGVLYVYQNQSGAPVDQTQSSQDSISLDPAITTNDASMAILQNVYQTLVAFNGSGTGPSVNEFVPNLAMCVPGSELCKQMYGSSLESNLGSDTAFTFVINPNATFYNASTGAHAPVRPNDVAFSLVRSCLYANVPGAGGGSGGGYGAIHGSYLCWALLSNSTGVGPTVNASWDGGLHSPMNNTPARLLNAITVNDSTYCTPQMMDGVHGAGCVTLLAYLANVPDGDGVDLMASLASPGESIVQCNWLATEGAGLAGWTHGGSCLGSPPSPGVLNDTAWDSYISAVPAPAGNNSTFGAALRFNAVGSGPYALESITPTNSITPVNYSLVPNPYWAGTSCEGGLRDGCLPPPTVDGTPSYIPRVVGEVTSNAIAGEDALLNGTADLVQLPSTDPAFALNGLAGGKFGILQLPTPVITFYMMNALYSPTAAASYIGETPTLPAGALQDFAFRSFLSAAYPHATAQQLVCSPDGTEFCFQYGGFIPSFTDSQTPTNLTWPVSNPSSNAAAPGSAAWWWNQVASDSLVGASCHASSPCTFPMAVPGGNPGVLLEARMYAANVTSLSGGSIVPVLAVLNPQQYDFDTLYYNMCSPNPAVGCRGPSPFALTWQVNVGDLDQPGEYFTFMTNPGSGGIAVDENLSQLYGYSSACSGPALNPAVTQGCQGTAFSEANFLASTAISCSTNGGCPAPPALLYNMADHIFANLSLYVPTDQISTLDAFAPWIDSSTLDLNPVLAAMGEVAQPYYDLQYLGIIPPGYPLTGGSVSSAFTTFHLDDSGTGVHVAVTQSIQLGETTQLVITSTGGTGIYSYTWHGLPPGCASVNSPALRCTPSATGDYSVYAVIVDSEGHRSSSPPTTIIVTSAPPPGPLHGFLGLPGDDGWYLIGGVGVLAIGVVVVAYRSRRGTKPRPPEQVSSTHAAPDQEAGEGSQPD